MSYECLASTTDMALLPEGGLWFRIASINMALLTEGECPNSRATH
jgi:hypothetical protein